MPELILLATKTGIPLERFPRQLACPPLPSSRHLIEKRCRVRLEIGVNPHRGGESSNRDPQGERLDRLIEILGIAIEEFQDAVLCCTADEERLHGDPSPLR